MAKLKGSAIAATIDYSLHLENDHVQVNNLLVSDSYFTNDLLSVINWSVIKTHNKLTID